MMDSPKPFSEEATKVLETYITNVRSHLSDTELSDTEIDESITELRQHIITHCEIKSESNVITTDLVREAIKKLGNPKTIADTLQSELDFATTVSDQDTGVANRYNLVDSQPSTIGIRAKHISAVYSILSWTTTALLIFLAFDQQFSGLSWFFPFVYGLTLGLLILTRNLDVYRFNQHLRRYVRPNFHICLTPLLYVILTYSNIIVIERWFLWTVPASTVMWLIISSTEYGRQFYIDIATTIKSWMADILEPIMS